ncbi:MAG: 23S rRNA (guanosine(2251)-2'-O)-methyltransferase RlmB [Rikenellaceae bacterium]|nr:23S rRNA (guanosine(2251)-2'-O)-methyltransferase RlmB [Rikenellaceae bacterium]
MADPRGRRPRSVRAGRGEPGPGDREARPARVDRDGEDFEGRNERSRDDFRADRRSTGDRIRECFAGRDDRDFRDERPRRDRDFRDAGDGDDRRPDRYDDGHNTRDDRDFGVGRRSGGDRTARFADNDAPRFGRAAAARSNRRRDDSGRGFDRDDRSDGFDRDLTDRFDRDDRAPRDFDRRDRGGRPRDDRDGRGPRESDDSILFGIRPVIEAIEAGRRLERIFVKKGAEGVLIAELRDLCRERRLNVQEVPVEKLNRMTRGNHQGVVATISPIEYADLATVLEAIPEDDTPLVVVFDGVTDVRNFGAIARSAECAGAHALVVPMKNSAPVNADAVKTSAGALNLIPVCRVGSLRNTLKLLQQRGMQLVAATEKSNTLLFEADLTRPTVIVMGSEDTGISKEIIKMCDVQLAIPIVGTIASLNVGAAAAVMLFETVRQRKMNQ